MPHTPSGRARAGVRVLHRLAWGAAVPAALVLTLTGCGGTDDATSTTPQVAALPTSAAPPGPATKTGAAKAPAGDDSGRPQMRLDDSPEQHHRLIKAWDDCLLANGARLTTAQSGPAGADGKAVPTVESPVPAEASTACMNKLPLDPPELDPDLNKHYRDEKRAEVECLRDHGIMVHLVTDTSDNADGLSWTYDEGLRETPADSGQTEHDCEMAAFGGKK